MNRSDRPMPTALAALLPGAPLVLASCSEGEPTRTALLEAVILGDGGAARTEIVRLLVDAGADVSIPDGQGVTALEHARAAGYEEIVAILAAARK